MSPVDYDGWARSYDATRSVSPSVLAPMVEALGPARGRSVLDIGGGTGNYALPLRDAGFAVTLCDVSPAMLQQASQKLGTSAVVAADAERLPFASASFDCEISVQVLGHLPDWPGSLREARRVLRDGPFVIRISTRETMMAHWALEYFPSMLQHHPYYPPEGEIAGHLRSAGFREVAVQYVHYAHAADGTFQALKHYPEAFLGEETIMNTASLKRLPVEEAQQGLAAIRRDHASGYLQDVIASYRPLVEKHGDGALFFAQP